MALTRPQILFLLANAALGALVALAAARVPSFAALPVPQLGWLVAGVLLTDVATGVLTGAHPTAVISMPVRIAALALSLVASLGVATALTGAGNP
ncbi:MAG: hypothetical protein NW223_10945 [Hyphomicrobiaceae bacterium]|nr:hypothetical protein [Hyphomicrobiaceae bacterium]